MKSGFLTVSLAAVLSFPLLQGCCQLVCRPGEEKNLRNQFHLGRDVRMLAMESSPKTSSGWFGREGLRIRGVFQFEDARFEEYVRALNDPAVL